MPNTILYHASSDSEVCQCAYSLLKYLEVYNLKPPSDHSLVVYTNDPASLEMYGSFFNSFELKELSSSIHETLTNAGKTFKGNVLYLSPGTYPVKPLEPLFAYIERGEVYKSRTSGFSIAGFNTTYQTSLDILSANGKDPGEYIAQYENVKEFNSLLQIFFKRYQEESVPNQVKLIHHIDARSIQQQKEAFNRLPFYIRWAKKVLGRGWNISAYMQRM